MTRSLIRGRLNPLWLQKQAEKKRLAHAARINRPKAEAPLLDSAQAKASNAKFWKLKKAEKERKRDEARAARAAARKADEGADLFDTALEGEKSRQENQTLREKEAPALQKSQDVPGDKKRRVLAHYQALRGEGSHEETDA